MLIITNKTTFMKQDFKRVTKFVELDPDFAIKYGAYIVLLELSHKDYKFNFVSEKDRDEFYMEIIDKLANTHKKFWQFKKTWRTLW